MVTVGSRWVLSPYPKPRRAGELVEHGPYRIVRHPIYSSMLVALLGVCLVGSGWGTAALAAPPCLVAGQGTREEAWLREHYPATTSTASGCATGSSPAFCDQFPTRSNRMIVPRVVPCIHSRIPRLIRYCPDASLLPVMGEAIAGRGLQPSQSHSGRRARAGSAAGTRTAPHRSEMSTGTNGSHCAKGSPNDGTDP